MLKIQHNVVEDMLTILETLKGETLKKTALYLKKRGVEYGFLPDYLKDPKNYPGTKNGVKKIVDTFLTDVLSVNYFELQESNIPLKLAYNTIFESIFFQEGFKK